jgi:transposase
LPADHFAWFLLATVEQLDLAAFYEAYRPDGLGRPAFDPRLMVGLLLYAYSKGQQSSRGIELGCVEDVGYRVVAANQKPDHATIAAVSPQARGGVGGSFGERVGVVR